MPYSPITFASLDYFAGAPTNVNCVCLDVDLVIVTYVKDGDVYAIAGTVSAAGSVSWGTAVNVGTISDITKRVGLDKLSTTHFVVGYSNGSNRIAVRVGSLSGTAITLGTEALLHAAADTSTDVAVCCGEGSNAIVTGYKIIAPASGSTIAYHLTISGTTITNRGGTNLTTSQLLSIDGATVSRASAGLNAVFCGTISGRPYVYHMSATSTTAPTLRASSGVLGTRNNYTGLSIDRISGYGWVKSNSYGYVSLVGAANDNKVPIYFVDSFSLKIPTTASYTMTIGSKINTFETASGADIPLEPQVCFIGHNLAMLTWKDGSDAKVNCLTAILDETTTQLNTVHGVYSVSANDLDSHWSCTLYRSPGTSELDGDGAVQAMIAAVDDDDATNDGAVLCSDVIYQGRYPKILAG